MQQQSEKSAHLSESVQTLILMLLAIFVSEMAVSHFLRVYLPQLGHLEEGTLDTILLVLFIALPLAALMLLPVRHDPERLRASLSLLAKTLGGIAVAEILAMIVLPIWFPDLDGMSIDVADACLTTLLSAFPVWWFFSRTKRWVRGPTIPDLLQIPLMLFVLLLLLIFLTDLLQELVISHRIEASTTVVARIIDSFVTTVVVAPILWLFVTRPLSKKARLERMRVTAILERANEGILTIDGHGAIKHCNQAAERIFGEGCEEIRNGSVAALFADGERAVAEMIQWAQAAGESEGGPVFHEVSGRRCDGTPITIDLSISGTDPEEGEEYLLIMRDMTDRKAMERELRESEARFRTIFEHSADAIIFFERGTGRLLDANATAEGIYGYSREELVDRGLGLVARGKDLELMQGMICGINEEESGKLDSVVNYRKDGGDLVVSVHGKVLELQGTEVVWCTMRDITQRVRLEQEARNIQAGLIQANKMTSLGLLVSGVAHNINNPNGIIMANTQLLYQSWGDALKVLKAYQEENGEFLVGGLPFSELEQSSNQLFTGILEGARRINETVSTLKTFARDDRGAPSAVDLNRVADSAVSLLRHVLVRYTDNFHVELARDLPRCQGNPQQLGQVVVNLLMNACQALTGKQEGIWLTTGYDPERREVTIGVRDEGRGIPTDIAARIMEPFFTTKLDSGGTGLGLSICRSIVKDHNGELDYLSESGKGAQFTVRIPVGGETG